jgi:hypothetical protein
MYTFLSIIAFFIISMAINAIIVSNKKAKYTKEGKSSHQVQELVNQDLNIFIIIEFICLFLIIVVINNEDIKFNKEIKNPIIEESTIYKSNDSTYQKKATEIESEPLSNYSGDVNPCLISEDFIKEDLRNPETADFSMFDCTHKINELGYHRVLRSVKAKNSFGVEKKLIYEVVLEYNGGSEYDYNSWSLISIRFEEMKR